MIHIASEHTESFLRGTLEDKDIQPNAVDLRLAKMWKIGGGFRLSEEVKTHARREEIHPTEEGWFSLEPQTSYEITFENTIEMGEGEAGWVITRSTLNRNGIFLTSGLYDSGYGVGGGGVMAGALHNTGGIAAIKKGTRIGQFILFQAQALKMYDGSYGRNPDGTVKVEDQRYG